MRWLKNPRAHASSHYVVARTGKIVQLVHLSDIAWHAGNWRVNSDSVGIEHEGFTYGPDGFTGAQYRASARLTAWIANRSLMPIDRAHIIGHADVPAPGAAVAAPAHHTDPGPNWQWSHYLRLVRHYAGSETAERRPAVPAGPAARDRPLACEGDRRHPPVEFSIDGRVVPIDRRAPFTLPA